ncbi:MAG TPA: 4-(cytidine 5'-diphospho)-2-C-methyl-D-erythritol kinase [Sphingomicrobium sp.]|nr:4-(cytidine 5'-diphospho)-2-C-methyl-D-erythritol kinase [Sphingomicrobium sp.]
MELKELAPAKLNLALHVRGKLPDGRHKIETVFAFCTDGDEVSATASDELSLSIGGPFARELGDTEENLALKAARALRERAGVAQGAALTLTKKLPVASGIGGGSADAAAALRLLTRLWGIDPAHVTKIAPTLGADVPACLLSLTARGDGAGDELTLVDAGVSGKPVLLVNPRVELSTADVFARWSGEDKGPLEDWHTGRNDLEGAAVEQVPLIGTVLAWLAVQPGVEVVRMSGSGATCFALFASEEARDNAEVAVPREWWRLATYLR